MNIDTILQESDESGTIKILYISMMYLYTEFPDFNTNIYNSMIFVKET
jgi:hypothetical protein